MNGLIFETLCERFLISSKFNAVIAAFSTHLSISFLGFIVPFPFFIQPGESVYEPPRLKFIS